MCFIREKVLPSSDDSNKQIYNYLLLKIWSNLMRVSNESLTSYSLSLKPFLRLFDVILNLKQKLS